MPPAEPGIRRIGVIAQVDIPEDCAAAEAWIERTASRLTHVSEQEGCGCCILLWTVAGQEDVIASLPDRLRCDSGDTPPPPGLRHRLLAGLGRWWSRR